jgi:hypothetical protein
MDFLLKLVKPYLPEKDQAHPLFESSLHEPGIEIEPLGQQSPGFITEGQFEGSPPAIKSQVGLKDSSHDRFDFSHRQLGDRLDLPAVLVDAGEKIKSVFHGDDISFLEDLRQAGSHPFNKLDGSLEVFPGLAEFRLRRPGLAGEGNFILALQILEDFLDLQEPGL